MATSSRFLRAVPRVGRLRGLPADAERVEIIAGSRSARAAPDPFRLRFGAVKIHSIGRKFRALESRTCFRTAAFPASELLHGSSSSERRACRARLHRKRFHFANATLLSHDMGRSVPPLRQAGRRAGGLAAGHHVVIDMREIVLGVPGSMCRRQFLRRRHVGVGAPARDAQSWGASKCIHAFAAPSLARLLARALSPRRSDCCREAAQGMVAREKDCSNRRR